LWEPLDELEEPDAAEDVPVPPVGRVHELFRPLAAPMVRPPDDEDDVLEVNDVPPCVEESPCMDERRVMISRNVGRMVGSLCQQLVMSSSYSGGQAPSFILGICGRIPSRMTATATAAGLRVQMMTMTMTMREANRKHDHRGE
jgi:hypothetical protein